MDTIKESDFFRTLKQVESTVGIEQKPSSSTAVTVHTYGGTCQDAANIFIATKPFPFLEITDGSSTHYGIPFATSTTSG